MTNKELQKKLSRSEAMVRKYSAAIKRSHTCLKRWERRLRYYEKKVQEMPIITATSKIGRLGITRRIELEP